MYKVSCKRIDQRVFRFACPETTVRSYLIDTRGLFSCFAERKRAAIDEKLVDTAPQNLNPSCHGARRDLYIFEYDILVKAGSPLSSLRSVGRQRYGMLCGVPVLERRGDTTDFICFFFQLFQFLSDRAVEQSPRVVYPYSFYS